MRKEKQKHRRNVVYVECCLNTRWGDLSTVTLCHVAQVLSNETKKEIRDCIAEISLKLRVKEIKTTTARAHILKTRPP